MELRSFFRPLCALPIVLGFYFRYFAFMESGVVWRAGNVGREALAASPLLSGFVACADAA